MRIAPWLTPLFLLLPLCAHAEKPVGLRFSHHDWELVCDNTRTCRAAGYQADDPDLPPVSVLFTRKAGPGTPVSGELQLGSCDEDRSPRVEQLNMSIDARPLGAVAFDRKSGIAPLSEAQVAAMLTALTRSRTVIEWKPKAGKDGWRLSDKGAAAVLLKMDEFQGRIGTRGALVRKGQADEAAVLPALPVPVVHAAPLPATTAADKALGVDTLRSAALRKALLDSVGKDDDCMDLKEGSEPLSVTRLSADKLLVSTRCYMAAYNSGHGYWVVNDKPPYRPQLVTTYAEEGGGADLSAAQKGRGLGDCWESDTWTWDGRRYVHTQSASTGMCKWSLPAARGACRRS